MLIVINVGRLNSSIGIQRSAGYYRVPLATIRRWGTPQPSALTWTLPCGAPQAGQLEALFHMKQHVNESAEDIMKRIRAKHKVGKEDVAPIRAVAKPVAQSKATKPKAAKPAPAPKAAKAPKEYPLCACGCNEHTKGGTYRPGHDSKHRSAQAGPKVAPLCKCGCGDYTRGGTFLPGHDAKYHSAMRKIEKENVAKQSAPVRSLRLASSAA